MPQIDDLNNLNLKDAAWLNSPEISKLFEALNKGDEESDFVRVVGGAIRNHILGCGVKDIDLATTLTPEEVTTRAQNSDITVIPTGIEHGTVTLVVDHISFEVTTLREDVKTDGRHAQVEFGKDWLKDARRRDFTINALYVSLDGTLHDPLGTGLEDLKSKTLRFIGDPNTRIREDYLRILRLYRLKAQYSELTYDQAAISATIKQRTGLNQLSGERVRDELLKLLSVENPADIINSLYQNGLLTSLLGTAPNLLPALKLIELENHLNLTPDPMLRLGELALWHRGDVKRLSEKLRLSKRKSKILNAICCANELPIFRDEPEYSLAHKIQHYRQGTNFFLLQLLTAWAKSTATPDDPDWSNLYKTAKTAEFKPFPISGEDLIEAGLKPGPGLGEKLAQLEEIWLEEDMQPDKTEILSHLNIKH